MQPSYALAGGLYPSELQRPQSALPRHPAVHAWQASFNTSRNQIGEALDRVVKAANSDWSLARPLTIVLAANAEDGAIHIDAKLLERIEQAHFFLADLTPVYADGEVLCPNPNALFEAGYAMGNKSPADIFLVVQIENTLKLKKEHDAQRFPFDIANINQIQYKTPSMLRDQLTAELQARLRARGWMP